MYPQLQLRDVFAASQDFAIVRAVWPAYTGELLNGFLGDDLGGVDISVVLLSAVRAAPAPLDQS